MTDPTERDDDLEADPAETPPRRTRRAVLRSAGFAAMGGGAALLAACSSGTGTSAAPTSAQPPAGEASPARPSISAADVPDGSGVILDNADYVVTQPTKGAYKAFTAICTHQQCKVSEIRGDRIHCGCHGSEFSIKDGSVVNPPAQQPLRAFSTTVSRGKVFVDT